MVHVHSNGDILLTAPNGRVHIQSLIFTQEIGNPANGIIPGARAPAPIPPIEQHGTWLGGFAKGLFDSTVDAGAEADEGQALAQPSVRASSNQQYYVQILPVNNSIALLTFREIGTW